MNTRIGSDITLEQIRSEYDAVFLGLGAQSGRPLPVEGSDAPNCVTATAFLKAFNDGRMRHVGKRVVVVGGGDTSIDVATVARRLGVQQLSIDTSHSPFLSRPRELAELLVHATTTTPVGPLLPN